MDARKEEEANENGGKEGYTKSYSTGSSYLLVLENREERYQTHEQDKESGVKNQNREMRMKNKRSHHNHGKREYRILKVGVGEHHCESSIDWGYRYYSEGTARDIM